MEGLVRCSANYVPLSPISFLERAGSVYRDRTSIIYDSLKYTWKETRGRCLKLASALAQLGISRGDVVAVLAPNIPPMYELHFGVPMAGAVLCTLNVRHNSEMLSFIIRHSETKVIFVDYQLLEVARGALHILRTTITNPPLLIPIGPPYDPKPYLTDGIHLDYESLVATGSTEFEIRWPNDELDPIAINYTSGTTSSPKGVVSTHRGAYLNGIASVFVNEIKPMPVYLWTVPMFHANGWALVWGVATQGGTNVCLRNVSAEGIFNSIALHKITNMGVVPTVLNMILNAPPSVRKPLPFIVDVMTGGAPPPYQAILKMEELGFRVAHSYGLTETSGPALVCTWNPEWDSLPPHERAKIKSQQGIHHAGMEKVDVVDPVTMKSVPEDAKSIGEVMVRGNPVMHGYFKNLKETEEAFRGGWFRTGDLAVKHPNGYIQLKDRSKDIIISGGENVSSIEVESVLYSHPAVVEAAVVARPDDHWGETPCAFVKLKEDQNANAENIIMFCRERLPHYMAPRTVLFEDLPKTATGKILKSSLRQKAKAMGSLTKRNTSKI